MISLKLTDAFEELEKMVDDSVEAVISDPPYDFKEDQKEELVRQCKRVSRGAVVLFCPPENQFEKPDQFCFWNKPISTKNTSRRYSRFVEMIFVWDGKWNTERNWAQYVNVFTDLVEGGSGHPFEKPVSLMRRLVQNHTDKGDLVLDPFMGRCTTGIACLGTGRSFLGFEKKQEHFDASEELIRDAGSAVPSLEFEQ